MKVGTILVTLELFIETSQANVDLITGNLCVKLTFAVYYTLTSPLQNDFTSPFKQQFSQCCTIFCAAS